MNIKAGDIVVLKSGGPNMTVKWVDGSECYCEWFDGKKAMGNSFTLVSLKLADQNG